MRGVLASALVAGMAPAVVAATFNVTPTSAPINSSYTKYTTYNNYTKQYYMLRSYLEKLEASGGGVLNLAKGTYTVPSTLYVPGKVTINLADGVVLAKGTNTGTSKFTASRSLFQFVSTERSSKTAAAKGYGGESGIRIYGKGSATIDMKYMNGSVAMVFGNNSDVIVKGITFRNMYDGNYIRMSACSNLRILRNRFLAAKPTSSLNNPAILLCVPDAVTNNFAYAWSATDKTPNNGITISGNTFDGVERAIGSNVYTPAVYHKAVTIRNNTIRNTGSDAIRAINWENVVFTGNTLEDIRPNEDFRGLLGSGVRGITASGNTFRNLGRPMQFMPYRNLSVGSTYAITYNVLDDADRESFKDNDATNCREEFVRINKVFNEFEKDTEYVYVGPESNNLVINPDSRNYKGAYQHSETNTFQTRHYFLIRSCMEALERQGGGSLVLESGIYRLSNSIAVPSNVTITFRDGVVVRKIMETGTPKFDEALTMFECIRPSRATTPGIHSRYNGETNIHFIGEGNARIDLDSALEGIAITCGHNTNISVKGLRFTNSNKGHFMEVDATSGIVISGNTFEGSIASPKQNDEAINLDTPDLRTQGFDYVWTAYDSTPNRDVLIENNLFRNLDVAVGTHLYSQDKYHTNVVIRNNTMNTTRREAIRMLNWKDAIIENNLIMNVADKPDGTQNRGILASGVKNPMIRGNTFKNMSRPIQFMPFQDGKTGYAPTYNRIFAANRQALQTNTLNNVVETFVRINSILGEFVAGTEKIEIGN